MEHEDKELEAEAIMDMEAQVDAIIQPQQSFTKAWATNTESFSLNQKTDAAQEQQQVQLPPQEVQEESEHENADEAIVNDALDAFQQ